MKWWLRQETIIRRYMWTVHLFSWRGSFHATLSKDLNSAVPVDSGHKKGYINWILLFETSSIMQCAITCYINFIVMMSVGSMNFSTDETEFWSEIDNLYESSDLDRCILVQSFEKEKLLKHFHHCSDQEKTSELCVHVMKKVTQGIIEKRKIQELKRSMPSELSIRNNEVITHKDIYNIFH